MDIPTLLKFLEDKDTYRCGWGPRNIETTFETMPSEFLGFAEVDLQSAFEHKYINALSNAKRALDCQSDRLLKFFGWYAESQRKFWGFPKKLELLQKLEVVAPRILSKINRVRNLLEHQYIKPNSTQVEDFLDIVSLFIASTDRHITSDASVDYTNDGDTELSSLPNISLTIDYPNEKLIIKPISRTPSKQFDWELEVKRTDQNYIEIFKRHLKKTEFQ